MKTTRRFVLLLTVFAVLLAACAGINPPDTSPEGTEAPATTAAPEPTEAPGTTASPQPTEAPPAEEGEDSNTVWWFLALAILAFLLVGILIGRGRKDKTPPVAAAAVVGFKDHTRDGYSQSRWLMDTMNEDLAIWRGNALFEGKTTAEDSAGTAHADNWAQLDDRMTQATDALYQAEASAPDQTSAATVKAAVSALNEARAAVDARAEARFNTRGVDDSDQFALAEAAERERLASSNLSEAHQKLNDALTALSALS